MKALETLQGFEQDTVVRQTLLDALQSDANSGVRIEAMNLLLNSLRENADSGAADPQILNVLRDRLRNDPNKYVRLQSAAALRELGADEQP
jgi:HEAT repeat protein